MTPPGLDDTWRLGVLHNGDFLASTRLAPVDRVAALGDIFPMFFAEVAHDECINISSAANDSFYLFPV
jgi:hypothetical protein